MRDHVQVAGGAAADSGLALALEPDPRAVLDPGGNLHGVALRPPLAAGAAAARARLLEREHALALGLDPAAAALRADDRRRPRAGARAGALAAGGVDVDGDP